MNETELLESAVSEYRSMLEASRERTIGPLSEDHIMSDLSSKHDWTHRGAQAVVYLSKEYGAFMLRNALALAIALEQEDGPARWVGTFGLAQDTPVLNSYYIIRPRNRYPIPACPPDWLQTSHGRWPVSAR